MTVYRSRDERPTLSIALRSEAPWLLAGILGLLALSSGFFVWVFSHTHFSAWLGLIPALTTTVFGGSAMSMLSRRKGASLFLDLDDTRAALREPGSRQELLDFESRFSATILADPAHRRRMLVLGQHGDPIVLLDLSSGEVPESGLWRARTRVVDLSTILLSPASSHVVTLADGASLDPVLSRIEPRLNDALPWFSYPVATGEILRVEPSEVCLGRLSITLPGTLRATAHAVQIKGGTVAGIGFADADSAMILLACDEAPVPDDVPVFERSPDAYLPHTVFEVIRAIAHPNAAAPA